MGSHFSILLLIWSFIGLGINGTNNVYECETGIARPSDFCIIEDCPRGPCVVHKHRNYSIDINFSFDKDYEEVYTKATVNMFYMDIPYPGYDNVNCCDRIYYRNSTPAGCPLYAGEDYTYKNDILVFDLLPETLLPATIKLVDENGEELLCSKITFDVRK